jgi:hypothetical protein
MSFPRILTHKLTHSTQYNRDTDSTNAHPYQRWPYQTRKVYDKTLWSADWNNSHTYPPKSFEDSVLSHPEGIDFLKLTHISASRCKLLSATQGVSLKLYHYAKAKEYNPNSTVRTQALKEFLQERTLRTKDVCWLDFRNDRITPAKANQQTINRHTYVVWENTPAQAKRIGPRKGKTHPKMFLNPIPNFHLFSPMHPPSYIGSAQKSIAPFLQPF